MTRYYCIVVLCWILTALFAPTQAQDSLMHLSLYDIDLNSPEDQKISIISASKVQEDVKTAPATVYVVTADEIHENGYMTLLEVLENIPGVVAINPDYFALGGQRGSLSRFSQTLLLINGRPMQSLMVAEAFISQQFATHNIAQIEVVQGPSSTLYGANALVGIINIITKSESSDFKGIEVQLESGSQNWQSGSVNFSWNKGSWKLGGSIRIHRSDNWDFSSFVQDTVNFSNGSPSILQQSVQGSELYNNRSRAFPASFQISYNGFYAGHESYMLETAKGLENIALNYRGQLDHRELFLNYIGWKGSIDEKHFFNVEYQRYKEWIWGNEFLFNPQAFDSLVQAGRSPSAPITEQETLSYFTNVYSQKNSEGSTRHRLNLTYKGQLWSGGSLLAGYTYDRLDLLGFARSSSNISPDFNGQVSADNPQRKPFFLTNKHSLYAQFKKALLNETLYLTMGARYDRQNLYGSVLNTRAGVVYQPTEKMYFKVLAGQAFREPTIFEYGALNEEANLSLKPIRINSYELSGRYEFNEDINIGFTGYYNNTTNIIIENSVSGWKNSDDNFSVLGLEATLNAKVGSGRTQLNYTYTNPQDQEINGKAFNYLNNYPHRINWGVSHDIGSQVVANIRLNYYSKITAFHGNESIETPIELSGFINANATLSTKLIDVNGIKLQGSFRVRNILNGTAYHPNISRGGPMQFLQPGRQFIVKLSFLIQ